MATAAGEGKTPKELALEIARGLVEQGEGETMMPAGTWGMRKPMTAARLVKMADRMAKRAGPPSYTAAPTGGALPVSTRSLFAPCPHLLGLISRLCRAYTCHG
jgi:hypothetical protein